MNLAQKRSVEMDTYNVICKLTDSMKMCLTKMSKPVTREVRVGYASVIQIQDGPRKSSPPSVCTVLATVLISVFTLCYGPGLLFRGPPWRGATKKGDSGLLCLIVVFLSIFGQWPVYYIIWGQNRLHSHSFQNVSIIRRHKIWRI
jgi:hypothetical protein